jgi:hypothetical protein
MHRGNALGVAEAVDSRRAIRNNDAAARHVRGHPPATAADEQTVSPGEGIDAVVMGAVGEGDELVQERLTVPAAHELHEAVRKGGIRPPR